MKRIMLAALFGTALLSANAQADGNKINLGYNALETALTEGKSRIRLVSNIDFEFGKVSLGYHGMNQIEGGNDSYFGNHVITFGKKGGSTNLAGLFKTNDQGTFNEKIGVRNTSLPNMLWGGGYMDVGFNEEAANVTVFYGGSLTMDSSFNIYNSTEIPYQDKIVNYTELLIKKPIIGNVNLFYRMETADFNITDSKHLIGISFGL